MDELRTQLLRLGEAAENDVEPIDPATVIVRPNPTAIDAEDPTNPRPRLHGRRRRRSRRAVVAMAATLLLALGSLLVIGRSGSEEAVGITSAQEVSQQRAPTNDNGWHDLRFCESTADYTADTGNTFFGAYQFARPTFRETAERLGLTQYVGVNPATAPPHVQDAIANAAYLEHGVDLWPICGRFLRGPMITPVVPAWLSIERRDGKMLVFLDPDVADDNRRAEIGREIASVLRGSSQLVPSGFVDKQEALDEFAEMFADDLDRLSLPSLEDMPARFEYVGTPTPELLTQLRAIPGVFEVVDQTGPPGFDPKNPLRLSIPSIELDEAVFPTARIENLDAGLVPIGLSSRRAIIGGFGSVEHAVFSRLDELQAGDLVTVSSLVSHSQGSYETVHTFEIVLHDGAPVSIVQIDQDLALDLASEFEILLVADVADDPLARMVARATLVEPESTRYLPSESDS